MQKSFCRGAAIGAVTRAVGLVMGGLVTGLVMGGLVTGLVMGGLVTGLGVSLGAGAAQAREIKNWPCRAPYREDIAAQELWDPPPQLDPAWRDSEAISQLVYYTTNPENAPDKGRKAIAEFAAQAGADKDQDLIKVFSGMLDEINDYHDIIIAGIRNFILRAKILAETVDKYDAALADPDLDAERREEITQARFWDFRNMDDAEEEAEFICHRMNYLKKKLGLLTDQLRSEMSAP